MKCQFCSIDYSDELRICPNCGAPARETAASGQSGPADYSQPADFSGAVNYEPSAVPSGVANYDQPDAYHRPDYTKKEFLNLPEMGQLKSGLTSSAVILYICAVFTFLVTVLLMESSSSILDVILLVGLGLLVQLKQSRVAAVLVLIYSLINCVVLAILTGRFGGWLIMLAGGYAIGNTFRFHKAWNTYQTTGELMHFEKKNKKNQKK
ncbi:MAG: hypothetical protein IJ711_03660 [Lachnospiraceae bacterium]|nr:hypothetical protein [Lachnospiraceae bacterium]